MAIMAYIGDVVGHTAIDDADADVAEMLDLADGTRLVERGVQLGAGAMSLAAARMATEARVLPVIPPRRAPALRRCGLAEWAAGRLGDHAAWEFVAVELCAGRALVHNAISASRVPITDAGRARFLDWLHAHQGPSWTDLGLLAICLIQHGHSPEQAEEVVSRNAVLPDHHATTIVVTRRA